MAKLELDPQKIYKMPDPVFIKKIDSYYLVIASETANWLLLQNEKQLEIFQLLSGGKSVKEVMNGLDGADGKELYHVLVELEAKKFENLRVNYPQEHGMYMYLTNRCNQRCRHCYMYAGEQKEKELTTEEVLEILKEFSAAGGKVVTFTGGEATTRPDFKIIVTEAKKNGLVVGVLSNGINWPQEWFEWVGDVIDEVQISVDGFDAESYRTVRGTDTFATALDTVERLVKLGLRVTVAVTPLLETLISNEEKYIRFAKQLLEKYDGNSFFVKFNTELMDGRTINPTNDENVRYRKSIKMIKDVCAPYSESKGFALDHINNTIFNNCGYGGLTIASNGDIYCCNLVDKCAKQGNVRNMSFDDIMNISKKARELSDINHLLPCKNCALKYLCGGGCRVKHFKSLVNAVMNENANEQMFIRENACTEDYKDSIYRMMIKSNALLYR
ncbi:MAG: radical SAM protein [Clostridiaceae bacterium]|nr:radical SAM protein [Clostridiaceae bacterium]